MRRETALLIILAVFVSACAKKSGDPVPAAQVEIDELKEPNEAFWKDWKHSATNTVIQLQGGEFGYVTSYLLITTANPATCQCTGVVNGTETAGIYAISNCFFTVGVGDPGCGSFDSTGTYTATSAALQLCDTTTSTCTNWEPNHTWTVVE